MLARFIAGGVFWLLLPALGAAGAPAAENPASKPPGPVAQPAKSADGPQSQTSQPIDNIEIAIQDVRWQLLPEQVNSVAVSPDGRAWYLLADKRTMRRLEQSVVQQVVEREFAKPSPQLQGVRYAFFEKAGLQGAQRAKLKRLWLVCEKSGALLGFDGTRWTEGRPMTEVQRRTFDSGSRFFQLQDAVVFVDSKQAHVFAADGWTSQPLGVRDAAEKPGTIADMRAWVAADGRSMTALCYSLPGARDSDGCILWRFREGRWLDVRLPAEFGRQRGYAAMLGEKLYVSRSEEQQVGRRATTRTRKVVQHLIAVDADNRIEDLPDENVIDVGSYRVKLAGPMGNDCSGTFYASCEEGWQARGKLGPGIVACNALRGARYMAGEQGPLSGKGNWDTKMALPVAEGRQAWVYSPETGRFAFLLDMEKFAVVDKVPDASFGVIDATDDGKVFVGGPWRVGVYRPGSPETRKVLRAEPLEVKPKETGFCVGGDGSIWLGRGPEGLQRFDGKTWQSPLASMEAKLELKPAPLVLIPGQQDWMLCLAGDKSGRYRSGPWMGPTYFLLSAHTVAANGRDLGKLAAEKGDQFEKAFAGPRTAIPWFAWRPFVPHMQNGRGEVSGMDVRGVGVVVDKNRNVWSNSLGRVTVAAKKGLLEVSIPPDRDNPSGDTPRVADIALLGDGEYVFLRLWSERTFFARLTAEGEFDFLKGPKLWHDPNHSEHMAYTFQDHAGGLWLTLDSGSRLPIRDDRPLTGITVRRLTGPEQGQDFTDIGVPELVDAAGCVWLAPPYGLDPDLFTIWAPGGATSTLRIPGRNKSCRMFSGEKGRVFVWTEPGLRECVAEDPDKPGQYKAGTVYSLEAKDGPAWNVLNPGWGVVAEFLARYSSLGYIVVLTPTSHPPDNPRALYLFSLGAKGRRTGDASADPQQKAKPKAPAAETRTWNDATGSFSVAAEFVSAGLGKVTLRKADGSTVTLPLQKLSEADQEYLRQRSR